MKYLEKYSIEFKGLSEGIYQFEFTIGEKFFTFFQQSEIEKAKIRVKVEFTKQSNSLALIIKLKGVVQIQCDRCLDLFDLPIKYKAKLNVGFGEENSDITDVDDTLTLSHAENKLQLAQHFFEYINLSLPYRRLHSDKSQCNQEMLKKIKKYSVTDENQTDPRWEKLKSLYN